MRTGFVPGFRSDAMDEAWNPVYESLETSGFDPYGISVEWSYSTMEDNVEDVFRGYQSGGLFGHSFGALACLYAALRVEPAFVVASSPSPYLAEYIDDLEQRHRDDIGKRRVSDFRERSVEMLSDVRCPVLVVHEDQELMREVAEDIGAVVRRAAVYDVEQEEHRLLGHYDEAISYMSSKLS